MYKSTFYDLKLRPKITDNLYTSHTQRANQVMKQVPELPLNFILMYGQQQMLIINFAQLHLALLAFFVHSVSAKHPPK